MRITCLVSHRTARFTRETTETTETIETMETRKARKQHGSCTEQTPNFAFAFSVSFPCCFPCFPCFRCFRGSSDGAARDPAGQFESVLRDDRVRAWMS